MKFALLVLNIHSFAGPAAPGNQIDAFGSVTGLLDASTAGYMIATNSNAGPADVLDTTSAELQPGEQVTIILQLEDNVKSW